MPLIRDDGITSHPWRLAEPDEPLELRGHIIVPLERLDDALDAQAGGPLGVALPNTADAVSLVPHFAALDLITIAFPGFADGRGFSLAKRLRAAGYEGELWAEGRLIADQYAFARSCGFDSVLVDDAVFQRQPEPEWLEAAASMSPAYQSSVEQWAAGPRSILELRRGRLQSLAAE